MEFGGLLGYTSGSLAQHRSTFKFTHGLLPTAALVLDLQRHVTASFYNPL